MAQQNPEQQGPVQKAGELDPLFWLGAKNTRDIIHVNRNTILRSTRELIDQRLDPMLEELGGLCVFRAIHADNEYTVLVTRREPHVAQDDTVIAVNCVRSVDYDEPHFPDGRAMDLTDVVIPKKIKWFNFRKESLYRHPRASRWETAQDATLLQVHNNTVNVFGNLRSKETFEPFPARNTADVADDAECLWRTYEALRLCNPVTLENHIRTIGM